MGVFGLHSFMEANESFFEPVSLPQIAEQYRNEMNEDPVMLVDISSAVIHLADENMILGIVSGGLKKFKENFQSFVNNCVNLGIKLKIFGEGMKPWQKRENWKTLLSSRLTALEEFYVEHERTSGLSKKFSLPWKEVRAEFLQIAIDCCLSNHKCEFQRSIYEADDDIIRYMRRGCFAVWTNDADFIVAEGARYCLSAKKMNLDTMMMHNYNRNKLAKFLNISSSQLLIFGVLLNRAYFGKRKKFFTKKLKSNEHDYIETANTIKNFSVEEIFEGYQGIKNVLKLTHTEYTLLKDGLQFLLGCNALKGIQPTGYENWDKILALIEKRHRMGIMPHSVLGIIVQKTFDISIGVGNILKPGFVTGLRPLREKIYGILFFEYPQSDVYVYETGAFCEKEGERANCVTYKVSFCRLFHPGLITLWSTDSTEKLTNQKVFYQALNWKLTPSDLNLTDVPKVLLFPLLVGFYLHWESAIKIEPFKIEILLVHSVLVHSLSAKEIENYPIKFYIEALDLGNWFTKTISLLYILNAVCGEPFSINEIGIENYFDGRILHYLYGKMTENTEDVKNLHPRVWAQYESLKTKLYQLGLKCGHVQ